MVLRIFFLGFLFLKFQGFSQMVYPILDQNPSNIVFKQINIPKLSLRLIFPDGADSLAFKTATFLNHQLPVSGITSSKLKHKWTIILQNQGLISNGFISLFAPRGEFYTTPSQDASLQATNDWLNLLASHETRHIFQNELARTGLSRFFRLLWGSNGQGLYSNLMIPNWLWEGDAIETESRNNNHIGRSNIPQFTNTLNAYLWQFGVPSYSKIMSRNYKENMPNHYVFGQYISQELTSQFGIDFVGNLWNKTLNDPQLFSFSKKIKKLSGYTIDTYVESILKRKLDSIKQEKSFNLYPVISPVNKKDYTSYDFPQNLGDNKIIAIKSSFADIPTLVEIHNSKERSLCLMGPMYPSNMLSASSKFVIWSEIMFHPRWSQKQLTRLVLYDFERQKKEFLHENKKWICPSISPDSKYISFIELQDNGFSILKIMSLDHKKIIDSIRFNTSVQIIQPRISSNGLVSYVHLQNGRKILKIYDFITQKKVAERDFGTHNIAAVFLYKECVYFNLPNGPIDQLARWDFEKNKVEYVTNTQFGAYSISFSPNDLDSYVFNQYSALGNQICNGHFNESHEFVLDEKVINRFISPQNEQFISSSYSRWNLLNPYAWGPIVSSEFNKLDVGLISKNITNSFQLGLGFIYDANEKTSSKYLRASYQGLFPVFDFSFQQGSRNTSLYIDKVNPKDSLRSDQWIQTKMDFGIRLPLVLTHGAFQESLNVSSTYSVFRVEGYNLPLRYKSEAFDGTYSSMIHQINYSKLLNKSQWDIQSKWGYQINLYWNGMPFKQSIRSELWGIQAKLFLPGLLKNHGLSIKTSYQQVMKGNYNFNSPFIFTRGYLYEINERLTNLSLDYKFPIANTSIKFGRFLYFTRFKGNLFLDLGKGIQDPSKANSNKTYTALGFDFSSNFHLLRFSKGFELGLRLLFKPQTNQYEFYPLVLDIGF